MHSRARLSRGSLQYTTDNITGAGRMPDREDGTSGSDNDGNGSTSVRGQGPLRGRGRGRGRGGGRSRRGRVATGDRGGETGRAHYCDVGADGSSANVASAEAPDDCGEAPAARPRTAGEVSPCARTGAGSCLVMHVGYRHVRERTGTSCAASTTSIKAQVAHTLCPHRIRHTTSSVPGAPQLTVTDHLAAVHAGLRILHWNLSMRSVTTPCLTAGSWGTER